MDNPSFMGFFETFNFDNSEVIIVTLRIGYRHLDLAENYKKSKIKARRSDQLTQLASISKREIYTES